MSYWVAAALMGLPAIAQPLTFAELILLERRKHGQNATASKRASANPDAAAAGAE
jgi:hypothetical protein